VSLKRYKVNNCSSQLDMSLTNNDQIFLARCHRFSLFDRFDEKYSLFMSHCKSCKLVNKKLFFWPICSDWFLININTSLIINSTTRLID